MGGFDTHTDQLPLPGADPAGALRAGPRAGEDARQDAAPHAHRDKLSDHTHILVVSDFCRTPQINLAGGRDHYPNNSALVISPRFRRNFVFGKTDRGPGAPRAGGPLRRRRARHRAAGSARDLRLGVRRAPAPLPARRRDRPGAAPGMTRRSRRVTSPCLAAPRRAPAAPPRRTRAPAAASPRSACAPSTGTRGTRRSPAVRAVADSGSDVVAFADGAATVLTGGRVVAVDRSVPRWVSAGTLPAADGSGTWIVGVDGDGRVRRLLGNSRLEPVSDRFGLAGEHVLERRLAGRRGSPGSASRTRSRSPTAPCVSRYADGPARGARAAEAGAPRSGAIRCASSTWPRRRVSAFAAAGPAGVRRRDARGQALRGHARGHLGRGRSRRPRPPLRGAGDDHPRPRRRGGPRVVRRRRRARRDRGRPRARDAAAPR